MIEKLLKNNISNKLYMLGFVVAIMSYSLWQPIESFLDLNENKKGSIWFIGIAFSFCCYTSAYLFEKWKIWRWFPLFVVLICLGRFLTEVLFLVDKDANPEKYELYDYINFLITIFIVFNYYVKHRMSKNS